MSFEVPKWENSSRPTIAKQGTGWELGDSPTHHEFNWLNTQTQRNLESISYVQNAWRFRHNVSNETPSQANTWVAVVYATHLELFVAIASNGVNRVMTSPDGETWTNRTAAAANTWTSLCYSPELELLVAVSFDGASRVMTSTDGVNWTSRTAAQANGWRSVCWAGGSINLFTAVSEDGTNRVMTSPDGIAWTVQNAAQANQWFCVTFSPDLDLLVAVSLDGTNRVMTSLNGSTWTVQTITAAAWLSVCWSQAHQMFVTITAAGNVAYSEDGETWVDASDFLPQASGSYTAVFAIDALATLLICSFVAWFSTSLDGEYWQSFPCADVNARSIAYAPDKKLIVMVGSTATSVVLIR